MIHTNSTHETQITTLKKLKKLFMTKPKYIMYPNISKKG